LLVLSASHARLRSGIAVCRRDTAAGVRPGRAGRFDLDDVGAQIAEDLAGEKARLVADLE